MAGPPDPTPLIELLTAYWGSATLMAANRLEIFTHLAKGAESAEEVARSAHADPQATEQLLAALVGLGLVTKKGAQFANTPMAETFLVKDRPTYLGPAIAYNRDVYPLWGRLAEAVESGVVPQAPDKYLGEDEEKTRNFVYGMHHRALGVGRALCQVVDFAGRKHLADVGGGPGTFSALLTERAPGLMSDVLDLPPVVKIANEIVAGMGAAGRVRGVPFDYYKDELSGKYDAGLISGVLHREKAAQAREILRKLANVMEPGGVLYISDYMLNDERTGPLFTTMFALNMRLLAHDGRCHSVADHREWLDGTGFRFTDVHHLPPPTHVTVIRAERCE